MKRTLAAPLLALGLLLSAGCSDANQSGDSNPDEFVDQAPGQEGSEPTEAPTG